MTTYCPLLIFAFRFPESHAITDTGTHKPNFSTYFRTINTNFSTHVSAINTNFSTHVSAIDTDFSTYKSTIDTNHSTDIAAVRSTDLTPYWTFEPTVVAADC